MRKLSKFLVTCFLLTPCVSFAEDLLTIYNLAQVNDPTIQAAKEAQLAAQEAIPQARAQFFPVIAAVTNNQAIDTNTLGSLNSHNYQLTLAQPIFYYQQWVQYAQADDQVMQANAVYASAEQSLILRTITGYFNVLKATDALRYARAQKTAFAKFLEQSEHRFKAGLIAITDVEIARARHDNASALVIAAENELANQKEKLREIICFPVETLITLKPELEMISPEPQNIEQWVAIAIEQNYDLKAADYKVCAARKDVRLSQGGHMPTLTVNGVYENYSNNSSSSNISENPAFINAPGTTYETSIALNLTFPLFNGGAIKSKTRQAMHTFQKIEKEFETLYRQVESNTRQAFRGTLTQISQAEALKQAIVSNKAALKATNAAFTVGTRTIVDVLNAQSDLIKAEQDYAVARYNYILQSIQLKQAAGTLNPDDVCVINAWLQVPIGN